MFSVTRNHGGAEVDSLFSVQPAVVWSQLCDLFLLLPHARSADPFLLVVLSCLSASPSVHVSQSRAGGFMTDVWVLVVAP